MKNCSENHLHLLLAATIGAASMTVMSGLVLSQASAEELQPTVETEGAIAPNESPGPEISDSTLEIDIQPSTSANPEHPEPFENSTIPDSPDSYSTQARDLQAHPSQGSESQTFGLTAMDGLAAEPTNTGDGASAHVKQAEDIEVPSGSGEIISDIIVRFIDRDGQPTDGVTRPYIVTREFDLAPGDVYDPELARLGLFRVTELDSISQASLDLEPADEPNQVVMIVTAKETVPGLSIGRHFSIVPGVRVSHPAALQGITRPSYVRPLPPRHSGFRFPLSFQYFNIGGNDQTLTFSVEGGSNLLGFDLTFRDPWIGESSDRIGYAINAFATNDKSPTFRNGPTDLELANGDDPWVYRVGGGIELTRAFTDNYDAALGVTYQVVSIHDSIFGSEIFTEDEAGNPLTIDDDGTDTLLTLNLATHWDRRNNTFFPTSGTRVLFGVDQALPVGEADIFFTRVGANASQFIPIDLIRVPESSGTLIFNLQGGVMPLDAPPPYEAFILGGSSSVRGYGTGEVGSPRNFLQGSLEYRFPFATVRFGDGFFEDVFGERMILAGNVFFDAATGFDSDDTVVGRPGDARDKPGEGYGYGLGVLAATDFGLTRLEFGITGGGDTSVIFTIGDRF